MLEALGCAVIDSDSQAKSSLSEPTIRGQLQEWWGQSVLNAQGHVDRGRIAKIVFDDPIQRERLEGLIYPLLANRRRERISQLQEDEKVSAIVLDSPLLYEKGLSDQCDCVIFVEADEPVRLRRVDERRGWDRQELHRRERFQDSLEEKRQRADYVVENNSDLESCRRQVELVFKNIIHDGGRSDG